MDNIKPEFSSRRKKFAIVALCRRGHALAFFLRIDYCRL